MLIKLLFKMKFSFMYDLGNNEKEKRFNVSFSAFPIGLPGDIK